MSIAIAQPRLWTPSRRILQPVRGILHKWTELFSQGVQVGGGKVRIKDGKVIVTDSTACCCESPCTQYARLLKCSDGTQSDYWVADSAMSFGDVCKGPDGLCYSYPDGSGQRCYQKTDGTPCDTVPGGGIACGAITKITPSLHNALGIRCLCNSCGNCADFTVAWPTSVLATLGGAWPSCVATAPGSVPLWDRIGTTVASPPACGIVALDFPSYKRWDGAYLRKFEVVYFTNLAADGVCDEGDVCGWRMSVSTEITGYGPGTYYYHKLTNTHTILGTYTCCRAIAPTGYFPSGCPCPPDITLS